MLTRLRATKEQLDSAVITLLMRPSYGILLTWHKGEWGYVNNNPTTIQFGSFESDTVCRQLGYTQTVPGSVQRVTSVMEKCG